MSPGPAWPSRAIRRTCSPRSTSRPWEAASAGGTSCWPRRSPLLGPHAAARGRAAGGAQRHALHALAHLAELVLAQLLLEELEVPPALAHLAVELGADGIVVSLLAHQVGRVDQSLLALDLLVDVHQPLVLVHRGGSRCARRRRLGRAVGEGRAGARAYLAARRRAGRGDRPSRDASRSDAAVRGAGRGQQQQQPASEEQLSRRRS